MIGRKTKRETENEEIRPKGFDDFEVQLGDMMRGERATLGKSLLDVQRELRIKASYIAAIENSDPSVFETPGFIAGYVRSYARYLGMDPEMAFAAFCAESGFSTAHGMSAEASTIKKTGAGNLSERTEQRGDADPLVAPATPFVPEGESFLSRIEPGAIGSSLVLMTLIAAIGFGGWSVLKEVQRVQLAPVEQTPVVASDLDPLHQAAHPDAATEMAASGMDESLAEERLDRLYRPQALDVPVLVARDAPISTLSPDTMGSFIPNLEMPVMLADASVETAPAVPQVLETDDREIRLVAVRPAWVQVKAADGSVIFEKILDKGENYTLPATEEPPTLRAGMSGSIYFNVNGQLFGPAGEGSDTVRDVALDSESILGGYQVADIADGDAALVEYVALAAAQGVQINNE